MEYQIISDMSIDIDEDFAKEHEIKYIPMSYMLDGEAHHCLGPETPEMMHEYYEKLRQKAPTSTSQISPHHYIEAFEPYAKENISLMYLCLSSGLSDTIQSAHTAVNMLKEKYPDFEIEIIDTLGATGGMGILAESAFENRDNGMSLSENAAWLRDHAKNVNFFFKVEDLMYLMRGGRVSAASAVLGSALNIKPILTIRPDGTLDTIAKKRGNRQAIKYLLDGFRQKFDPTIGKVVYISCADCMEDAERLKQEVLALHPEVTVRITMLSPIIGAHTGPNMMALVYYGSPRE